LLANQNLAPLWAIDLADCHIHDVDERLRRIPGTTDKSIWQKVLCGLLLLRWRQNQLTIGTMRGIGWTLYIEENCQGGRHWGLELECIGEAYDDGRGTLDALTDAARSTARDFENFGTLVPRWMAYCPAEQSREPEPPSGSTKS
jgi:hypothetical protein